MITIPDKLKAAVQKNNLVIFVGAGLSINLKNQQGQALGNWGNLVRQIIGNLNGGSHQFDYLLSCLDHYEPITVLGLIEKSKDISRSDIYDFVKGFFELHQDNNYALHRKIAALSNIVITTNYDTAFEESTTDFKNRVAYKGRNYELTKNKEDKPLLFKLHGCISDVGSMVLFPRNYDDLYVRETNDAKHVLGVLKNLIYNKTILFIGCGMGDFQINHIFKTIKEIQSGFDQPHFIIAKDRLDSSLEFLTQVFIREHDEIDAVLDQLLVIKEEAEQKRDKGWIEQQKQTENLRNELSVIRSKHKKLIEELFTEAIEFSNNQKLENAAKKYEQIASLEELDVVFFNWGLSLSKLGDDQQGSDAERLYREAIEKYSFALAINPNYYQALTNWGRTLFNLGECQSGKAAEGLYREAIEKYRLALAVNPDHYQALNNWALSLMKLGDNQRGSTAAVLYHEAIEKLEHALAINPDYYLALYNWGLSLSKLSCGQQGSNAERLHREAIEKYSAALSINPYYYQALTNWGNALASLGDGQQGSAAEGLYREAIEKLEHALAINPDDYRALNNWGNALIKLAARKSDIEAQALYDEAIIRYKQGIELGGKCYNLACLYTHLDNKIDALFYLDISLGKSEVPISNVKSNKDWEKYWQDADFLSLLEKYSK